MNQNHFDQLRKKFYEGKTSAEEEAELFQYEGDDVLRRQHDFYELSKSSELPESFDENLKAFLGQKEGRQIKLFWTQFSRVAAILLLGVLLGILYKDIQSEDVSMLREEMALVLSEQESAHLRLKGLELAMQLPKLQGEMLETIGQMLKSDENVNVRLEAFKALSKSTKEATRGILMNSVVEQESFLIQASIIKYLLSFSDPRVKLELSELLEKSEMGERRKKQIENLINL